MRIVISLAAVLLGAVASAAGLPAAGQEPDASGPFTGEQAAAGAAAYQANCAFCHGADLTGGPYAPPLTGSTFEDGWSPRTTLDLLEAIRTMPPSDPGGLGDDAHVDLAAFILQANGVASGSTPLAATATASIDAVLANRSDAAGPPGAPLLRASCGALADRPPTVTSTSARNPGSGNAWPRYGGAASNQRYAALGQITASNVAELGGAWMTRLPGPTNQSSLTMAAGRIFAGLMNCNVAALDAKTGEFVWVAELTEPPARRGLAVAPELGYVLVAGSGGTVTALDMATGEAVWTDELARDAANDRPLRISAAPTYADGVMLIMLGGGDSGRRGGVAAVDARTGAEMWRFYSIPGPDDVGYETWPNNEMWRAGGGGVWSPAAIDPELGMAYFGTGNPNGNPLGLQGQHVTQHPGPHPSHSGDLRPGDQLFAASVVALDLGTGEYRWHFQLTRHDIWDMDVPTPMVLYDTTLDGRPRKGIGVMRTDGHLFLLDRVDGSPLLPIEERPVPQDPFQYTAATQPFPVGGEQVVPNCAEPWLLPPGFRPGCYFEPLNQANVMAPYIGVRQAPMAYSPETGYFYVAAAVYPWWATRFGVSFNEPGMRWYGLITAVDSRTNRIAWQRRSPYPKAHGGGMLATAGNLVFYGEVDGNVLARDAATGELLWQFQTGQGADSAPVIAYELDGEQYIAVAPSGGGSTHGPAMGARATGDVVWAFKLGGTVQPARPPVMPPMVQTFEGHGLVEKTNAVVIDFEERRKDTIRPPGLKIDDYGTFVPRRVQVRAGEQVTWTNTGDEPHTISVRQQPWTTGPIAPGATGSIRFDTPGRYVYTCAQRPWQQGEITVVR